MVYTAVLYVDMVYRVIFYVDMVYTAVFYVDMVYTAVLYVDMVYTAVLYVDMVYKVALYVDVAHRVVRLDPRDGCQKDGCRKRWIPGDSPLCSHDATWSFLRCSHNAAVYLTMLALLHWLGIKSGASAVVGSVHKGNVDWQQFRLESRTV